MPERKEKALPEMSTDEYNAFREETHSNRDSYIYKFVEWFKDYKKEAL